MEETPIVKENNKFLKIRYLIAAVIGIVLIVSGIWIYQYTSKNFNLNVSEAEKSFKMEKYAEAKQYYQTALKYKANKDIQTKTKLCDDLQSSLNEFNRGTDLFNKKDYLGAVSAFKGVIAQDEKRFNMASDKISESSKLYIEELFGKAKDFASKADYTSAISNIELILAFNPNNDAAKTLKTQYQADLEAKIAAEAKVKAEADAKAKAQSEADAKALAKTQGVRIGMTQQQVLDSNWGRPNKINKTVTKYGTHEQWVYGGNNYLYFDNGILTSIQN